LIVLGPFVASGELIVSSVMPSVFCTSDTTRPADVLSTTRKSEKPRVRVTSEYR
jgi:hypothetical protein